MRNSVQGWKAFRRWALSLALLLLIGALAAVVLAEDEADWPGTTPEDLSQSLQNRAWQPSMAASDTGRMVVAWSDAPLDPDVRDIYAVDSSDYGHTWSEPQLVAQSSDKLLLPGTAIIGDRCFVSWSRQTSSSQGVVFYVYEKELGTAEEREVPGSYGEWPSWPRLAQDGGKLHMVFHGREYEPDILYTSRELTADWLTATVIYTHTSVGGAFYPTMAVEPGGDTIHVVWEERASGRERAILYMEGDASGSTLSWSPAVTLSTGITLSVWPSVVADSDGNVYVAWGEQVEEVVEDIVVDVDHYVRFSRRDAGSGVDDWSEPERVDSEPVKVNELIPTAVTLSTALLEQDGGVRLCVAWHGFREGDVETDEEVLLSCSTDQGETWSVPQNMSRTSGDESNSIWPVITFDGADDLHSVWQERAGVDSDIRYDYQIYHTRRLERKIYLPLVIRGG